MEYTEGLMKKVIIAIIVFIAAVCISIYIRDLYNSISAQQEVIYNMKATFVNVTSQVLLSVFTLLTLLATLWYSGLKRVLLGPRLYAAVAKDALHCVLQEGPSDSILNIYVHVENKSDMVAEQCQVSCNRIYAAIGDAEFHRVRDIQSASFKWARMNKESPYHVSICHASEMYFKLLQVVQQSSGAEESNNATEARNDESKNASLTFFRICIPPICGSVPIIDLPAKYDNVLIPITIVAKDAPLKYQYILVRWHGDKVSSYNSAGYLNVKVLSQRKGKKLIAEGE